MDSLEKHLAILLQKGDKCGPKVTDIAQAVGKSPATVHRKLKEMEKNGFVEGYVAKMDPATLGKSLTSYVWIQIRYPPGKRTHEEILDEYLSYFKNLKEVQEVHIPLGSWDILLKAKTKNMEDQYRFISEKLTPIGGIRRMESKVMMKTIKESAYVEPE